MQAVLIMDADVIYEPDSLRKMSRHLADPQVGSVTAYIKEGSQPGNYMTRFIGYEYVTAQAAARRSQNVLGVLACLAGGAQLPSRANTETTGGLIDTGTLAEDTVTTFLTELAGNRVIFEPHATVWAEEPADIEGVWKQRLRWSRGNIQITRRFRHLWFRPQPGHRLGSTSFGLFWFSLLLLPFMMICASASLVTLFFIDFTLAWSAFHVLWITNVITYVFITSFALQIDPQTGRRVLRQALLFPGVISVFIIVTAVLSDPILWLTVHALRLISVTATPTEVHALELFTYSWLAGCMGVSYLAKLAEKRWLGRFISPALLYIGGFGPPLCGLHLAALRPGPRGG